MRLTVSMAAHDDYDGVFFTVQSLRLHHALPQGTEILVLDNNPAGPDSASLRKFAADVPGMRVVPVADRKSSWVKYDAFGIASGDVMLGLDCHVLLAPGFITALLAHWMQNPHSRDLLTGPLLYDNLTTTSVKMEPNWRGHDFGTWGDDPAAMTAGVPFEIPMQGMGCFSLLRAGFVHVNSGFRGFGGEEWYIAEKVRRNGGRVLCHPALGWNHRFHSPRRNYPLHAAHKIRNYFTAWCELYGPHDPRTLAMVEHFAALNSACPILSPAAHQAVNDHGCAEPRRKPVASGQEHDQAASVDARAYAPD